MILRKKTKHVRVKFTPETHAAIEKVAATQRCSAETLVGIVMQRYVAERYPNAYVNLALRYEFAAGAAANGQ